MDDFFTMEMLEPRCPRCNIVLEYGVNTDYQPRHQAHVCKKCGTVLK